MHMLIVYQSMPSWSLPPKKTASASATRYSQPFTRRYLTILVQPDANLSHVRLEVCEIVADHPTLCIMDLMGRRICLLPVTYCMHKLVYRSSYLFPKLRKQNAALHSARFTTLFIEDMTAIRGVRWGIY